MQGIRIKDPVLRDRLTLSGEEPQGNKWLWFVILLIIAWIGAGIWFFYPELKPYVDPYLKDIMPQSTEQSQPVTETTTESPVIETTETTALTTQPVEEKAVSESDTSTEATTPSKVVNPVPEITQPVQPVKLTEKDIDELVKKAESQIKRTRFTSPEGDNAYETYQQIHKVNAEKAQPILDKLVAWYKDQADKLIKDSEILQPTENNAFMIYRKLEEIAPNHATTKSLHSRFLKIFDRRATYQLRKNHLTEPEDHNVYATYSALLTLDPQRSETQTLFKTLINKMLKQAKEQVAQHKYTTPEGDNAYETYRKIINIDPDNTIAQQGIKDLAKQYYLLAISRKNKGRKEVSLEMAEKGLLLEPNNESLLKLREELNAPPQHSLLRKGKQQAISGHLMQPLGDNAYVTYQKLRKEDNAQAILLLEAIAEKYHSIAAKQYRQGKTEKSLATINEGLSLTPRHEDLQTLKKKILKRLSE